MLRLARGAPRHPAATLRTADRLAQRFCPRPVRAAVAQVQQNALFAGHDEGAQNRARLASLMAPVNSTAS